jgi:hypothetical protein
MIKTNTPVPSWHKDRLLENTWNAECVQTYIGKKCAGDVSIVYAFKFNGTNIIEEWNAIPVCSKCEDLMKKDQYLFAKWLALNRIQMAELYKFYPTKNWFQIRNTIEPIFKKRYSISKILLHDMYSLSKRIM